ncbi:LysR family transcriptional regulator [Jiella endophytica]|uniref:LysR family transcriptional regulator n=2 Tax=Jiella endophytica TaxID=2558362 RepID=A0A4Y8RJB0_9HYPH|nr:LysR family transcriptional regulator [Jiella endophytica]
MLRRINCKLCKHACMLCNMNAPTSRPIASLTENDLRLMRIFRVVAECGGLTAAEARLHLERSTISRNIKALEERIGDTLCLRGPSGFELTQMGETVLRAAISACDTLDAVRDDLNMARNVMTGDLVIGIADNILTNPKCRLVEALADFQRTAPAVRPTMIVRPPAELVLELQHRHVHLCINGAAPFDADFVRHDLFDEEFCLYASRNHADGPVRLADLDRLGIGLVMRDGNAQTEMLWPRLGLQHKAKASGLEAVGMLIAGGRYVGYLPTHFAEVMQARWKLVEVEDATDMRYATTFYLNYERSRPLSAPARCFRDLLLRAHRAD